MNILFYGRECKLSILLMRLLHEDRLLPNIKQVCVNDYLEAGKPLPFKNITHVPTLIIASIAKPLVMKEAIEWVYQRRGLMAQQQKQNNVIETQKKLIMYNIMKNAQNQKGPIAFIPTEMSGFSDDFAFTEVDLSPPRTFFGCGDEEKHAIFTAPTELIKMNIKDQKNKINLLASKREEQDKENEIVIKQNQITALIESEKQKIAQKILKKT